MSQPGDPSAGPAPAAVDPDIKDTPSKSKASTEHASNRKHHLEGDRANQDLWHQEVQGKVCEFEGSVAQFLDHFLPCDVDEPADVVPIGVFTNVPQYARPVKNRDTARRTPQQHVRERDMYKPIVDGLNAITGNFGLDEPMHFKDFGEQGPYWKVIHGSSSLHRTRPDIAGSRPGIVWKEDTVEEQSDWTNVGLTIEAKRDGSDPMNGKHGAVIGGGAVLLRQICKNARNALLANSSCFVFVIAIFKGGARFFKVDRAGAVASKVFQCATEAHLIATFLWRLVHPNDNIGVKLQGDDPTVRAASAKEKDGLRSILESHHKTRSPQDAENSRRITIRLRPLGSDTGSNPAPVLGAEGPQAAPPETSDQSSSSSEPAERHYFTLGSPRASATSLFARGTVVWDVVDLEDPQNIYVLKDSWRQEDRTPESDFYEMLEGKVDDSPELTIGLPVYDCGADLHGMNLPWQRTNTASAYNPDYMERVHMRVIMKTVGIPLTDFTSTKQLVEALRDAIKGHQNALDKGVLHRDISIGNVMIAPPGLDFKGFIHDFDYSVQYPRQPSEVDPSNKERTGTFFFMARDILRPSPALHMPHHDLESFYWLLVFLVLRHVRHEHRRGADACSKLFDRWTSDQAAEGKIAWYNDSETGTIPIPTNKPLEKLLKDLRAMCARGLKSELHVAHPATHEEVLAAFDLALDTPGWPANDKALPFKGPSIPDARALASANASDSLIATGSKRSISSALGDSEGGSRSSSKKGKGKSAS